VKENCQVELCQKSATYGIYRGVYPEKRFVFVCGTHEHLIAADNLDEVRRRAAGNISPYGASIHHV
jgi:hypothetical protein